MGSEFSAGQFDALYPEGIERFYWNKAKNLIVASTLRKYGSGTKILEVGCGKGIVVNYLRQRGFSVRGVELAHLELDATLKPYIRTGVDFLDLPSSEYEDIDTVLLCDVLEHVEEPSVFLRRIREHLPGLKRFVVTVPARQEIFSNYDEFNGHYRRYDVSSLLSDFSDVCPKAYRVGYAFHSLYPLARILLRLKGARPVNLSSPSSGLRSLAHGVLALCFLAEFKACPRSLYGTTLIGVFEVER